MKRMKFTVTFKAEAVRMVIDGSRPIVQVARELNINPGTLGNWVDLYRGSHPVEEEPLKVSDRIRLRELEVENRELRMKNEFLGKAVDGPGGPPVWMKSLLGRLVTSTPLGA